MSAATEAAEIMQLSRLDQRTLIIHIEGTAPLITHRFSEKAKQMMLEAQQKKTRAAKPIKDPEQDADGATYWINKDKGVAGMPCVAFKAATIGAARYFDKKVVNMTQLRGALRFEGWGPDQLVEIRGVRTVREDTVRVGMGTADLRYRPMFDPWAASLTIVYLPQVVTQESIISLVEAGGMGGVGEFRPSKCATGSYGTYTVSGAEELV